MSEPNLREEAIDEAINRWDEAHAIGYREGHRAAKAEASRIDVETLARAFVAVGMVIDGMTAAEARQMVERLAAEYEKLS
jgi:hypothetical protein